MKTQSQIANMHVILSDLFTAGLDVQLADIAETGDGFKIEGTLSLHIMAALERLGYNHIDSSFLETDCILLQHPKHTEYYLSFVTDEDNDTQDRLYMVEQNHV